MFKILPFLLLFSVYSFGQKTYKPELLQFTDGLPSEAVLMTLKKDGFLYVATQRGLCMYDGYVFINSPELSNAVHTFIEKDGKIYGEEIGVGLFEINNVYDKKRIISAVNYTDTIQDNDHFKNIYKDGLGNIWCSDFHFVKYFNPQKNTTKEYRIENDNKQLNFDISYLETPEELIIAGSPGVFIFEKNTEIFTKLSNISFSSVMERDKKLLLFSTKGELFEYLPDTRELVLLKILPEKRAFSTINTDDMDFLMLHDTEKLYRYTQSTNMLEPVFVSEGRINHVFFDHTTRIFWISTQKGLIKLTQNNNAIQTISLPDSSSAPVTNLVEDGKSRIWMVKDFKTLFVKEGGNIRAVSVAEDQINHLSFREDKLLLATGSGVYLKDENDIFRKIISTGFSVKKAVYYNNKYWLLPESGAITVYDSQTLKEIPDYIKNDAEYWNINLFNDIEVSTDNQLWLASWMPKDFGISRFDETERKIVEISAIPGNEAQFVADYFHRIAQLSNGNMIFSATGGFNIVNPNGEIVYSMFPRMSNVACDNIDGIAGDRNGHVWFGCAEGLYYYNMKTETPIRISRIDGLASNEITYGFLLSSNNTLYISNESSLEEINPDKILSTSLINELALTAVRINDIYLSPLSHNISVKEKETTQIELFFSALNFSGKDKLIYRYKFNDEEWHYLGSEPKLSLIKPTSGKYNITIEAGDNLGNWQRKQLEIMVNIIPPFYKTFWFSIILFSFFLLVAHFINVFLVNQEKVKGELKKKIKDNENKMLRSQMNPHFLFNSLNSINSFIIQNKAEEAEKYLTAFSKLMRNILDNSRKETISLKQELETVKLYLDLEAVRMENKFDYRISVSKDMDIEYVQIPPLILQPFLENAIWHGINYKQDEGFINIDVETLDTKSNDDVLIIKIKDDGVGRKAAAKRKNKEYAHKSYGIDITKERLELQGTYNSIEITDLYDDLNEPSGTLVTLKIHIKND